jgi:hypothetical protein
MCIHLAQGGPTVYKQGISAGDIDQWNSRGDFLRTRSLGCHTKKPLPPGRRGTWLTAMPNSSVAAASPLRRRLVILTLFGIVFGYVEAAAVVYIRAVFGPLHQRRFPDRDRDDLFPLFTIEQWSQEGPPTTTPQMEVGRELGTILIVALVAWGVSRNAGAWFASFVLAFGAWDIFYYLWLRLLIGWPRSLFDWDLVFAAPLPWVAPVLAPLVVAAIMVITGGVFLACDATERPIRPRWPHWFAVLAGGLIGMAAFWWDARSMLNNGIPEWFNWPLLLTGLALGLVGFVHALVTARVSRPSADSK